MRDYSKTVTWLPVTKNGKEIGSIDDISPQKDERNDFMYYSLSKGNYDINYVITLCSIILEKCHQMRLSPKDLQFTLSHSLQRLIAMLEIERDQIK